MTVLEGIRKRLGPGTKLTWAKGVEIDRGEPSIFDEQFPDPKPVLTTDAERKAEFERAIEMVKQSDVTVMVLGEAQTMSGERASRFVPCTAGKAAGIVGGCCRYGQTCGVGSAKRQAT